MLVMCACLSCFFSLFSSSSYIYISAWRAEIPPFVKIGTGQIC